MRHPLPYAFARTHQLLLEDDAGALTLFVHPDSGASAVSEVMRKYPVSQLESIGPQTLIQRISAAYAQGESSAAAVVSEVESDADLSRMMQGPACYERLAGNFRRRAHHPHAQRAADPGRTRWRQRHPY